MPEKSVRTIAWPGRATSSGADLISTWFGLVYQTARTTRRMPADRRGAGFAAVAGDAPAPCGFLVSSSFIGRSAIPWC
jgi:hypothetical protein